MLDLEARIKSVHVLTQDLMLTASQKATSGLLDQLRLREPHLRAVIRMNGGIVLLPPAGGVFSAAPEWIAPGFQGLFEFGGRYYLGAKVRSAQENVEAFTYLLIDDEMLATLTPGVAAVTGIVDGDQNTNVGFDPSGSSVAIEENGVRRPVTSPRLPPARNSWDVTIATILPWGAQTASGKPADVILPILSRPSRLLAGVVTGRMASVILSVLMIVGGFFLMVEIVSLISSVRLTRTITRSVHDYYDKVICWQFSPTVFPKLRTPQHWNSARRASVSFWPSTQASPLRTSFRSLRRAFARGFTIPRAGTIPRLCS